MIGWVGNIERSTEENTNFRTVLFTGEHQQLTLMSLAAGEDIGREMHGHVDQFLRVEEGGDGLSSEPPRTASTRPMTSRTAGRSSCRRACGITSSTPATRS